MTIAFQRMFGILERWIKLRHFLANRTNQVIDPI